MLKLNFPVTSQSRIGFWGIQQYTQSGMWWFTLFFGIAGLHHLLFRSPHTWIMFLIGNFFTFGYWWFYDLIQLSSDGGFDLNQCGLETPWGPAGIAQGMFKQPQRGGAFETARAGLQTAAPIITQTANAAAATIQSASRAVPGSVDEIGPTLAGFIPGSSPPPLASVMPPVPSPWYFLLYALLIPLAPLAQAIAGDTKNALSRFFYLTIVPFGFIFGAIAVLNDYYVMMSDPKKFFAEGSHRFAPFTWFGWDLTKHSPNLTLPVEPEPCAPETFAQTFVGSVGNVIKAPLILLLPGLRVAAQINPSAASLLNAIEAVVNPALAVSKASITSAAAGTAVAADVAKQGLDKAKQAIDTATQVESVVKGGVAAIGALPAPAPAPQALARTMTGGGSETNFFDMVVLAGIAALIGGGAILTAGRHAWTGSSDSPPLPGRL
jgi:hypothetical protein